MDIQKKLLSGQVNSNCILDQILIRESFDTELLQVGVARCNWEPAYQYVSESDLNIWVKHNNITLLFTTVSFEDLGSFISHNQGHQLTSSKIIYEYKSSEIKKSTKYTFIDSFKYDEDSSYWQEMIRDLSITSHYAKDSLIGESGALTLYRQWIKNTFSGYADKIFVAYEKNTPMGFISLKCKTEGVYIDLVAVHRKFRGRGLGQDLLIKAIKYAYQFDKKLFVTTQLENIPANRLYQKMGFLSKSVALLYHKHWRGE